MDKLRIFSYVIFEMIKQKIPHYLVLDTGKVNINVLIDLLDDAIFTYIQNTEEDIKPNNKIILLYRHFLTMTEHYNCKKGWVF